MTLDTISSTNLIALAGLLIAAVLVLHGHPTEGASILTGCFALLQHRPQA